MQHNSMEDVPGAMGVAGGDIIQHLYNAPGAPDMFQDAVSCLVFITLGAVGYISASFLLRRRASARVAKIDEKVPSLIEGTSSKVRSISPAAKDPSELMQQLRRNRRGTWTGMASSLKLEAFALGQLVPLLLSSACLIIARSFGSTRCWQEAEVEEQTDEEIPQVFSNPVKEAVSISAECRHPRSKKVPAHVSEQKLLEQKQKQKLLDQKQSEQNLLEQRQKQKFLEQKLLEQKLLEQKQKKQKFLEQRAKTLVPQAQRIVAAKTVALEQPRKKDHCEQANAFEICALRELDMKGQAATTEEQPLEHTLALDSADASLEAKEDGAEQAFTVADVAPESQEITLQCDAADSEDLCETDETMEPTSGEGSTHNSADEISESGRELASSVNEVLIQIPYDSVSCEEVMINAVQQRVLCEFEGRFRTGPVESLLTEPDAITSRSLPSSQNVFPEVFEPSEQFKAAFGAYYSYEVVQDQEELLIAQGDFPPGDFTQWVDPSQFMCSEPSEWFGDSFCPDGRIDDHTAQTFQQWDMASMGHDYDFESVDFSHQGWLHDWSSSLHQSGFGDHFSWHDPHLHGEWMQENFQTCEQSAGHLAPVASDVLRADQQFVCDDERHDPPPEVKTTGRTENDFIGVQLIAELGEWCAMKEKSEGGRPFFWNRSSGLRTWKMPQIMEDMGVGENLRKHLHKVQPPSHDMPDHERQLRATRLTLGLDAKRSRELALRLQAMHLAMSYASQQHRPEFVARLRAKEGSEVDERQQEVSMSIGQGEAQDALEGGLLHRRRNQKSTLADESQPKSRQGRRRGGTKRLEKEAPPQRAPSPAPPPLVSEEAFPMLVGVGLAPWVAKASP